MDSGIFQWWISPEVELTSVIPCFSSFMTELNILQSHELFGKWRHNLLFTSDAHDGELTTIRSALEWLVLLSSTARVVPTSAVPDSSTNHDSADRISGQFLFYHDHNFIKSKGNFSTSCTAVRPHWRRMTTGRLVMWQLLCDICYVMICHWMNDIMKICTSDAMNLEEITHL